MEDAVKASSWKPSSPIMAAMSNNNHDASPGAPDNSINMGMTTPGVAMRALAGQGNTPYWSPSTHAGGVAASPSQSGPLGDGPDGGLALTAQEFVPGGGAASGAAEFVPGVGVQQTSNPSSPQGQQQQGQQGQQQGQGQQGQGQQGQGQQASSGGVVDGRMYDQHLQEQGGATYSETPLILPGKNY